MMNDMIYDFKKNYIDWLNQNIYQDKINDDLYRIDFPYLDRNNDFSEIFVKVLGNDEFLLTDDAETINELELSGVNIFSGDHRKNILKEILNGYGVELGDNHELFVKCGIDLLPQKKHMLAQCMVKISDMFYLSRTQTKKLFVEDVKCFLEEHSIFGTPDVNFFGKSGLLATYDLAIPRSKTAPERLIKIVNHLDTQKAGNIIFLWEDTKEQRREASVLYTFLQDENVKIPQAAINAMETYGIKPILWSDRNASLPDLAA